MTNEIAKRPNGKPPLPDATGQGLVVGENTVVTLNFTVRDEEQDVLDDMHAKTPFKFVSDRGIFRPASRKASQASPQPSRRQSWSLQTGLAGIATRIS